MDRARCVSLVRFSTVPGTKIDLREDQEFVNQLEKQNLHPIKREQGLRLAKKIRAFKYVECSALTQKGLKQVRLAPFVRWIVRPVSSRFSTMPFGRCYRLREEKYQRRRVPSSRKTKLRQESRTSLTSFDHIMCLLISILLFSSLLRA